MTISFLVMPNVILLDIAGPVEVFMQANECLTEKGKPAPYDIITLSTQKSLTVKSSSGVRIECDATCHDFKTRPDTLFIPGTSNQGKNHLGPKVIEWIAFQSGNIRRICSSRNDNLYLTDDAPDESDDAPQSSEPEKSSRQTKRMPSGITMGMNIALALVEEDCGREIAEETARRLIRV